MNIVVRARRLLQLRLLSAAKVTNQHFSQAAVGNDLVKDFEVEHSDADSQQNCGVDPPKAEISLDPNWKKWWDGSYGEHPGRCRIPPVRMPKNFEESASIYLKEFYNYHPKEKVLSLCGKLCNVLAYRPVPKIAPTASPVPSKRPSKEDIWELYYPKGDRTKHKDQMQNLEKALWKQIVYDRLVSAAYLIGRTPGVYAATYRVLNEIRQRDPDFQPKAMLDYGSGTGTAVWAAHNLWGKGLENFFCVDWSNVMNEMSQYLLTGGMENAELTGIYLRLMLPVSFKHEYDIIITAYSLSELPSEKDRLITLKLLWEKTKKYLVIIERGEQQGYHMIMEARNLIVNGIEGADPHKQKRSNTTIRKGHIFAPVTISPVIMLHRTQELQTNFSFQCPQSGPCPKWKLRAPCNFTQSYHPPIYTKKFLGPGVKNEIFSYVILSKEKQDSENWPRVISDPHYHSDKVRCHLCAPDGQIHHIYMKEKTHESAIRTIARKATAGDRLPYDWPTEEG